ncbi:hypothetical protein J27TS7_17040 [Paenibacillus dendritiformis]|uniref:GntR family transcriptional regulator n=1 Tax=Paenibacillus dendritiformis TaxID=130049 RepID=UPI001B2D3E7B|nr:GntR family transcriptional regulator [Paenibacillus dendritiformis]GIO72190.1 hypothetical protein J27TS7_17040 [Paenibacillus dendritiformis]
MGYDSRSPLYVQVHRYIEERIRRGVLKPNDRIPTEKELMEQFKVSRITVVNALSALVKDGWIYRVPGRGSFVSNDLPAERNGEGAEAAALAVPAEGQPNRTEPVPGRTIGFVMPTLEDYFAMRLINAVQDTLRTHGYSLVIAFSGGSKEREEQQIRDFIAMGVRGLLLFPADEETYNEEILSLKVNGFPFVLIDRYLRGVETHFVCSDNRAGARMAVDHLWENGHRHIAICTNAYRECVSVHDRISGYMSAFEQHGGMINPSLIVTGFSLPAGEEGDDSELARHMKSGIASAYIALDGKLGMRMRQMAKRFGLRVPEDISLLTFDNPENDEDQESFFTYIYQNEMEIGRQAATILTEIIERRETDGEYRKVILQPQLIIGRSTGPSLRSNHARP